MSGALVVRPYDAVTSLLTKAEPAIAILLGPYSMRADRMIRVAQDALTRNPFLLECTPASIVRSVMHAAELGLEVGGPLGEAWFVPFWNGKKKRRECSCIPGYRGLVALAYDEPRVSGAYGEIVCEFDQYREVRGTHPTLEHEISRFKDRGAKLGAYGAINIRDGWPIFRVLNRRELDALRDDSLSKLKEAWQRDASPWSKHEDEMWIKSGLRRVCKAVPLSGRLRRALELDAREHGEEEADPRGRAAAMRTKLGDTAQVIDAEILDDGDA